MAPRNLRRRTNAKSQNFIKSVKSVGSTVKKAAQSFHKAMHTGRGMRRTHRVMKSK